PKDEGQRRWQPLQLLEGSVLRVPLDHLEIAPAALGGYVEHAHARAVRTRCPVVTRAVRHPVLDPSGFESVSQTREVVLESGEAERLALFGEEERAFGPPWSPVLDVPVHRISGHRIEADLS